MAFKLGDPRPAGAGRKAGVSLRAHVSETLNRLKCDPIEGMVMIAKDEDNSAQLRGRMFAELAQYVYPKKRSIEHSGIDGDPIEVIHSDATDRLRAELEQIAARTNSGAATEVSE